MCGCGRTWKRAFSGKKKKAEKKMMFPPGIEPGTLRV